jgi:hypothetical protein
MPVTKPDVSSSCIAALEIIVKEPEFGLSRKASATNDRISGETIVISNDGPALGYFYRDRSIKGADLSIHRKSQQLTKASTCREFAYQNLVILDHPRFRQQDFPFGSFPEFVELAVGDRAPLDAELADIDLVSWVFIVPSKLVVLHVQTCIVDLEIVMSKLDGSGTKRDGGTGRLRGSIPGLGK